MRWPEEEEAETRKEATWRRGHAKERAETRSRKHTHAPRSSHRMGDLPEPSLPLSPYSTQAMPAITAASADAPAAEQPSIPSTSATAPIPRDARIVALLLASMGIDDCEPNALRMLLDFAHREWWAWVRWSVAEVLASVGCSMDVRAASRVMRRTDTSEIRWEYRRSTRASLSLSL